MLMLLSDSSLGQLADKTIQSKPATNPKRLGSNSEDDRLDEMIGGLSEITYCSSQMARTELQLIGWTQGQPDKLFSFF
jgi:hypothetical protein